MVAFPDLPEPLTDGVVALRLFAERDIPDVLVAYDADPDLHRRLGEARPPSGAALGRYADTADERRATGVGLTLTVLEAGSDICRGEIRVHGVDLELARCELGMWLAPRVRGLGLAARAIRLASEWLTGTCGLTRLTIRTDPDNVAMRAAAERAGFEPEAVSQGDSVVLVRVAEGT